ncbi:hypothetical protein BGX29_009365 [Mortierella sp. GBA35]|nr:hypothetical protein BGX29_009365 [Mortierella sp. GBA35]KAG0219102.1 hypothetical protein BGX33_004672 [Mortierella sp. NVP41]
MLGARSNTSTTLNGDSGASLGDEQQLQDLESLSQRIRALEALLAPTPAPTRASGSGSGAGTSTGAGTGSESLIDEGAEDITNNGSNSNIMSPSSRRGTLSGGPDPHQVQHHPTSRHHHLHHQYHQNAPAGSLSRRVQKIETSLWSAARERKPTEEFLQKYEASNLITPPHGSHSDRELLTFLAKTELILAAQDELQNLAEESKDIQSLQRCAEIGGLKNVEPQYPVLSKLETIHIEQCQESNKVSDKMNKLTDDYNSLINTLSEVFLSWDALLTAAELKVSEVEKFGK